MPSHPDRVKQNYCDHKFIDSSICIKCGINIDKISPFSHSDSIMFIPDYIPCINCGFKYNTLELLRAVLLDSYKCENCKHLITKEEAGKYVGKIDNIKNFRIL